MYTSKQLLAEAIGTFFLVLCRHRRRLCRRGADQQRRGAGRHRAGARLGALDRGEHLRGHQRRAFQPGRDDRLSVDGPHRAAAGRLYIVAQLVGATVAAAACNVIFPAAAVDAAKLGIPLPARLGDGARPAADGIHSHVPADDGDLRHGRR